MSATPFAYQTANVARPGTRGHNPSDRGWYAAVWRREADCDRHATPLRTTRGEAVADAEAWIAGQS